MRTQFFGNEADKVILRSTMCDGRLSSITILLIESARAEAIDLNKFVDEFDLRHGNRKLPQCHGTSLIDIE